MISYEDDKKCEQIDSRSTKQEMLPIACVNESKAAAETSRTISRLNRFVASARIVSCADDRLDDLDGNADTEQRFGRMQFPVALLLAIERFVGIARLLFAYDVANGQLNLRIRFQHWKSVLERVLGAGFQATFVTASRAERASGQLGTDRLFFAERYFQRSLRRFAAVVEHAVDHFFGSQIVAIGHKLELDTGLFALMQRTSRLALATAHDHLQITHRRRFQQTL